MVRHDTPVPSIDHILWHLRAGEFWIHALNTDGRLLVRQTRYEACQRCFGSTVRAPAVICYVVITS
jgi:hypothetical protein